MQALAMLIAIVMIVLGVVQLVFPNFVWQVDKAFHDMNGIESKRSDSWELGRVVRAIVTILFGVLCIWISVSVL